MKKKIAILTQPLGLNYGGVMQNYALQQILKKMGYEPITINRTYNTFPTSILIRVKIWVYNLIHAIKTDKIPQKIKDYAGQHNMAFMKKNMKLTKLLDSDAAFYKFMKRNHFDCYIVGSDQTWRPQYSPNIDNYFLDFLNDKSSSKAIAYATSFGTDQWEFSPEKTKRAKELITKFSAVSVREDSGIALCQTHLNIKAELVLDPTLLLDKEDYINNLGLKDSDEDPYLFTYVLDQSQEKIDFINQTSEILNLKTKKNQSEKDIFKYKSADRKEEYLQPPLENWLSGFKNAQYVITDSFHGMVFSIIFRKPFTAIVNRERGASRFTSLLAQLNLEKRLVFDINQKSSFTISSIDYDEVDRRLEDLKVSSYQFLKHALQ